jgi:hypothetical protein
VTFQISVRLDRPVTGGHLGVGLTDDRDTVVAGWAFEPVALDAGAHVLDVTIPSLPLRPGCYQLSFAFFDAGNNLNGGRLIEKWPAVPPLVLDVEPLGHPQDAWAGVLNLPATLGARGEMPSMVSAPHPDRFPSALALK